MIAVKVEEACHVNYLTKVFDDETLSKSQSNFKLTPAIYPLRTRSFLDDLNVANGIACLNSVNVTTTASVRSNELSIKADFHSVHFVRRGTIVNLFVVGACAFWVIWQHGQSARSPEMLGSSRSNRWKYVPKNSVKARSNLPTSASKS